MKHFKDEYPERDYDKAIPDHFQDEYPENYYDYD